MGQKDSFIEEGRLLARFHDPNIVKVRRFFELNGTVYLVMDFCEGEPFDALLSRRKKLPYNELVCILKPLLTALDKIHSAGFLHRDIKPGNIFIKEDGSPVLLDFGAARQRISEQSRSMTSLATPGYAALEQYSTSGSSQGPYTDIYGLGATAYRAILGERPPDSTDRLLNETYTSLISKNIGESFPNKFLIGLDKALSLKPNDRQQSIQEFKCDLFDTPLVGSNNKKNLKWIWISALALFFISFNIMFFTKLEDGLELLQSTPKKVLPTSIPESEVYKLPEPKERDKKESKDKESKEPKERDKKESKDKENMKPRQEAENLAVESPIKNPMNVELNQLIMIYRPDSEVFYPRDSKVLGEQGIVGLQLSIDEYGVVSSVHVVKTSGFSRLDNAAEQLASRIRFRPYLVDSLPRTVNAGLSIKFQLN
jgi:TonB family protein